MLGAERGREEREERPAAARSLQYRCCTATVMRGCYFHLFAQDTWAALCPLLYLFCMACHCLTVLHFIVMAWMVFISSSNAECTAR